MNSTKRIIFSCLVLSAIQLLSRADEPLPAGFVLDKPSGAAQSLPAGLKTLTDADFTEDSAPAVAAPPKPLTPAQIKARDFMQGIAYQKSQLRKKAYALGIGMRQFGMWPRGYTDEEVKEYCAGEMGPVSAFLFERKCKKYISELDAMIANALKNIRPE